MDRGANIMRETRQRQFCRSAAPAYRFPRFDETNGMTCAGNFNGCRKAIRARPDHDCIEFHRLIVYIMPAPPAAIVARATANHPRWVVIASCPTPADAPVTTTISGCFDMQIKVQFVSHYGFRRESRLESDAPPDPVHVPAVHRFVLGSHQRGICGVAVE